MDSLKNGNCDVILTYSWNRVGYNILRSLSMKGIKVVVADVSKTNISSLSRYAYGYFTYPDPFTQEGAFIDTLLKYIDALHPRMLLPTHDEGLIIAKYRNRFPADLIIPIDSYEQLSAVSDKLVATKKAKEVGVPIPEVYDFEATNLSYPVVFKTKIGNSAKEVFFPENKEQLEELKQKYTSNEAFIQEKIEGVDCSVDCLRMKGFFYATVYRAIVTKTHGGGTTTQRIIVDKPELVECARKLLDGFDYQGVCGLDFKYNPETGKIAFIEINARFTGGLATPIVAGFDIPYILYQLAVNGSYHEPIHLKTGTKTKWILGDIITLVERICTFSLSWKDIKNVFNFSFDGYDDFFKDDKKAFWGECHYYFSKLWKNKKLNP